MQQEHICIENFHICMDYLCKCHVMSLVKARKGERFEKVGQNVYWSQFTRKTEFQTLTVFRQKCYFNSDCVKNFSGPAVQQVEWGSKLQGTDTKGWTEKGSFIAVAKTLKDTKAQERTGDSKIWNTGKHRGQQNNKQRTTEDLNTRRIRRGCETQLGLIEANGTGEAKLYTLTQDKRVPKQNRINTEKHNMPLYSSYTFMQKVSGVSTFIQEASSFLKPVLSDSFSNHNCDLNVILWQTHLLF